MCDQIFWCVVWYTVACRKCTLLLIQIIGLAVVVGNILSIPNFDFFVTRFSIYWSYVGRDKPRFLKWVGKNAISFRKKKIVQDCSSHSSSVTLYTRPSFVYCPKRCIRLLISRAGGRKSVNPIIAKLTSWHARSRVYWLYETDGKLLREFQVRNLSSRLSLLRLYLCWRFKWCHIILLHQH